MLPCRLPDQSECDHEWHIIALDKFQCRRCGALADAVDILADDE